MAKKEGARINAYVKSELKTWFDQQAESEGRSASNYIANVLEQHAKLQGFETPEETANPAEIESLKTQIDKIEDKLNTVTRFIDYFGGKNVIKSFSVCIV